MGISSKMDRYEDGGGFKTQTRDVVDFETIKVRLNKNVDECNTSSLQVNTGEPDLLTHIFLLTIHSLVLTRSLVPVISRKGLFTYMSRVCISVSIRAEMNSTNV